MGNPLSDALHELLPRKARLVTYVASALVLLGLGAWQAAEGNVVEAVTSFLAAFAPTLAAGNVPPAEGD